MGRRTRSSSAPAWAACAPRRQLAPHYDRGDRPGPRPVAGRTRPSARRPTEQARARLPARRPARPGGAAARDRRRSRGGRRAVRRCRHREHLDDRRRPVRARRGRRQARSASRVRSSSTTSASGSRAAQRDDPRRRRGNRPDRCRPRAGHRRRTDRQPTAVVRSALRPTSSSTRCGKVTQLPAWLAGTRIRRAGRGSRRVPDGVPVPALAAAPGRTRAPQSSTSITPAQAPHFGVMIAQEDGTHIVTFGGLLDSAPHRDDAAYLEFARTLARPRHRRRSRRRDAGHRSAAVALPGERATQVRPDALLPGRPAGDRRRDRMLQPDVRPGHVGRGARGACSCARCWSAARSTRASSSPRRTASRTSRGRSRPAATCVTTRWWASARRT